MRQVTEVLNNSLIAAQGTRGQLSQGQQQSFKMTGDVFNYLFNQLRVICTGSEYLFKDPDLLKELRIQWSMSFAENGVSTLAQIEAGLTIARRFPNSFIPAPGKFVEWCKEGMAETLGLPNIDLVLREFKKYCAERLDHVGPEAFPWSHDVMYWIVTDLYKNMVQYNETSGETRRRAERLLQAWVKKINLGHSIPKPVVQLENKSRPKTAAQIMGSDDHFIAMGNAFLESIRNKKGASNA